MGATPNMASSFLAVELCTAHRGDSKTIIPQKFIIRFFVFRLSIPNIFSLAALIAAEKRKGRKNRLKRYFH